MKKIRDIVLHTCLSGFMLAVFFIPFSASADTIRQPVGEVFPVTNAGTDANIFFRFVAPVSGFVTDVGILADGTVTDFFIRDSNVGVCDFSGTSCKNHPRNLPQRIVDERYYIFDFSNDPLEIIKGVTYSVFFEPRADSGHGVGVTIGHLYGTIATSTVFWGTSGTTTAYCADGVCPPGMVQPTFFITTTPLNIDIGKFSPVATSSNVDLSSAQSFCGSDTFATSTGFWDSTAQAFSRGLCLSMAYLFVPNADSITAWRNLNDNLQSKIPFSYAYGVRDIFTTLSASSTSNLAAVTFTLPAVGSTSPLGTLYPTTIVGLSTTTIGTYLNESFRQGMLGMQRVFLWLAFAYMVYRRIIPHHVVATT